MGPLLLVIGVIASALLGTHYPYGIPRRAYEIATQSAALDACRPEVQKDKLIKVDVQSLLDPIYSNTNAPGGSKEEKTWVLVKQNAPIPAWKVELEMRANSSALGGRVLFDPRTGEMEKLGTSQDVPGSYSHPDSQGKDIYIGVGWCNPQTGSSYGPPPFDTSPGCLDPLVQDVVYVLDRKGSIYEDLATTPLITCQESWITEIKPFTKCHDWVDHPERYESVVPHTKENLEKYFWTFNVYYDTGKLPAVPTYDDLPSWMKLQCPGGSDVFGTERCLADPACAARCPGGVCPLSRIEESTTIASGNQADTVLGSQVLAAQTGAQTCDGLSGRPCLIINKNMMIINQSAVPSGITIADSYIALRKLSNRPATPPYVDVGTAYQNHFTVLLAKSTVTGASADHTIVLDPTIAGHPEGPFWEFEPITDIKPAANSLQLGSFTPGIPSFYYEWWTPSCKPALYVYPEKKTTLHISVNLPNGYLTTTIPEHGKNGWNIVARPDGSIELLTDNRSLKTIFPYLYYEAALKNVTVPKNVGWVRSSKELPAFFQETLPKLGLNEKERTDFIEYWLPKLAGDQTWFIGLMEEETVNKLEPVSFSQTPDTFIRVRFYFEKLEKNFIRDITEPIIAENRTRKGFTVVDWGGLLENGSCGEIIVSY